MASPRITKRIEIQEIASHLAVAYSQLKQDMLSVSKIPSGSIGTVVEKQCNPNSDKKYLYRAYSGTDGKKKFDLIGSTASEEKVQSALHIQDFFKEAKTTLKSLRGAGYPMLDKSAVEILAGLFNEGLVGPHEKTLVAVGTTAYCALLCDLGLSATSIITRDVDVAVTDSLELVSSLNFEEVIKKTMPGFFAVPGMPSHTPSTSLKGPGAGAMRVDLLCDGPALGKVTEVKHLNWHAQAIPHLSWLAENTRVCLALSSVKAVPVKTPDPIRFAFHKAFCSFNRTAIDADKASKDRAQSLALLGYLEKNDEDELIQEYRNAPQEIQQSVLKIFPDCPQWLRASIDERNMPNA